MGPDMRLPTLIRRRGAPTEISGPVRLDRRTKNLTKRLQPRRSRRHPSHRSRPGECRSAGGGGRSAVVNAVPSVSGRYPNLGPGILLAAGIPLIDDAGESIFTQLHEGDRVTVDGDRLLDADGHLIADGHAGHHGGAGDQLNFAREGLADQIEAFAANTMDYLRVEKELLSRASECPDVATPSMAATCSSWSAATTTARSWGVASLHL